MPYLAVSAIEEPLGKKKCSNVICKLIPSNLPLRVFWFFFFHFEA